MPEASDGWAAIRDERMAAFCFVWERQGIRARLFTKGYKPLLLFHNLHDAGCKSPAQAFT